MKKRNQQRRTSKFQTLLLQLIVGLLVLAGCESISTDAVPEDQEVTVATEVTAALDSSGISLRWDRLDEADAYNLYRSSHRTDSLTGSPMQSYLSDTSFTDPNVQLDSTYYYRVTAIVDSTEGPSSEQIAVTNFTVDPIKTNRLVGAHYTLWWGKDDDWADRYAYTPELGSYDSGDRQVANQHIKWALEHGIRWFSISWAGPDHKATDRLEDGFLKAKLADKMKFSILYETRARFKPQGSQPIDMTQADNQELLKNDLTYIKEHYFGRDNYLHIDGQPVMYIYFAHAYRNEAKRIIQNILDEVGIDPYIIAGIPSPKAPDVIPFAGLADAVSTFDPYSVWPAYPKKGLELYKSGMHRMHLATNQPPSNLDFMPVAITGVHGTDSAVLETSPQRFKDITDFLQSHYQDARAVLVTSFNNWSYNMHIEPGQTYHKQYLDVVENQIATVSNESYQPPSGTSVVFDWSKGKEEKELNPNARGNRILSFMAKRITLENASGETIKSYNIGKVSEEPFLISGAYGTESITTDSTNLTGRWFGGYNTYTEFLARDVSDIGSITFRGRAITDMSVTVTMGDQSITKSIHGGPGTYTIDFQ